jgi:ribosomal protein S18 acetylase RimI-like enzyme
MPDYHRQGIGTELIRRVEEELRAQSVSQYFCFVHSRNEIGKAFYLKHSFVHVPERDSPAESDWCMEKTL